MIFKAWYYILLYSLCSRYVRKMQLQVEVTPKIVGLIGHYFGRLSLEHWLLTLHCEGVRIVNFGTASAE